MLGGERIWHSSHLWPNHFPELAISKDIISVYATQSGRHDFEKDNFYDELHPVVAEIPTSIILILVDDWNVRDGESSAV